MPRCISVTPAVFAAMSVDEKEATQRQQAQCLFDLASTGEVLTQSESDYVTQILGRVPATISNVPTAEPTVSSNISAQVSGITSVLGESLSQVSTKILLPVIIIALLVFGTTFLIKKQ